MPPTNPANKNVETSSISSLAPSAMTNAVKQGKKEQLEGKTAEDVTSTRTNPNITETETTTTYDFNGSWINFNEKKSYMLCDGSIYNQ